MSGAGKPGAKRLTRNERAALIERIATVRAENYDLKTLIDIAIEAESSALAKLRTSALVEIAAELDEGSEP